MLLNRSITQGHLGGFQFWGEAANSGRLSHQPAMKGEWEPRQRDQQAQNVGPLGTRVRPQDLLSFMDKKAIV